MASLTKWLRLVPVDFEAGDASWQALGQEGFGRRGLPIRRDGPREADCERQTWRWSGRTRHSAMPGAEAGGDLPVLAFDVVDDGGAGPGQQRRRSGPS